MLPIPAPQQVPRGLNGGPASAGTWIVWETASALAGAGLLRVQVLTVLFFFLLPCADDTFLALVLVSVQRERATVHSSCQVGPGNCPLAEELVTGPPQ